MAKQSREDGNNAFTTGNHELAITLYTEAMKYAQVHETLWEGETMAIAAANRYVVCTMYVGIIIVLHTIVKLTLFKNDELEFIGLTK